MARRIFRRRIGKPERGTPCGYCFENEASGWDHLIPVSAGGLSSADNLYPSCLRCNLLLGNMIFDSIDEKRLYAHLRLEGFSRDDAMRSLHEEFPEEKETPEILQPEVPVEILGEEQPEDEHQHKESIINKITSIKTKPRKKKTRAKLVYSEEHRIRTERYISLKRSGFFRLSRRWQPLVRYVRN